MRTQGILLVKDAILMTIFCSADRGLFYLVIDSVDPLTLLQERNQISGTRRMTNWSPVSTNTPTHFCRIYKRSCTLGILKVQRSSRAVALDVCPTLRYCVTSSVVRNLTPNPEWTPFVICRWNDSVTSHRKCALRNTHISICYLGYDTGLTVPNDERADGITH